MSQNSRSFPVNNQALYQDINKLLKTIFLNSLNIKKLHNQLYEGEYSSILVTLFQEPFEDEEIHGKKENIYNISLLCYSLQGYTLSSDLLPVITFDEEEIKPSSQASYYIKNVDIEHAHTFDIPVDVEETLEQPDEVIFHDISKLLREKFKNYLFILPDEDKLWNEKVKWFEVRFSCTQNDTIGEIELLISIENSDPKNIIDIQKLPTIELKRVFDLDKDEVRRSAAEALGQLGQIHRPIGCYYYFGNIPAGKYTISFPEEAPLSNVIEGKFRNYQLEHEKNTKTTAQAAVSLAAQSKLQNILNLSLSKRTTIRSKAIDLPLLHWLYQKHQGIIENNELDYGNVLGELFQIIALPYHEHKQNREKEDDKLFERIINQDERNEDAFFDESITIIAHFINKNIEFTKDQLTTLEQALQKAGAHNAPITSVYALLFYYLIYQKLPRIEPLKLPRIEPLTIDNQPWFKIYLADTSEEGGYTFLYIFSNSTKTQKIRLDLEDKSEAVVLQPQQGYKLSITNKQALGIIKVEWIDA